MPDHSFVVAAVIALLIAAGLAAVPRRAGLLEKDERARGRPAATAV